MKNKLYDFLDKHSAFISVFGIAAWLCFVFNLQTNKPVAIAAAVFMIVFICVASFLILGATYRSHARALQSLMDKRNSSHPHWDGHTTPQRSKRENPAHIVMAKTARYELKTDEEFIDRLTKVSIASGLTKSEAIGAGIDLLERLVEADRKGKSLLL